MKRHWAAATLLFGSGLCALMYQLAWFKSLRLVFGSSTMSTAATLAIFMGGLGIGGAWLGRRVDRHPNPLRFYAHLEIGIGLLAMTTPVLVEVARATYAAMGGSVTLGPGVGTAVRLVLSAGILGGPAVLMGGTLPAMARAVQTDTDTDRQVVALLYGANTLGAVTGAFTGTLWGLELFGVRNLILVFAGVNLAVGIAARVLSGTAAFAATGAPAVEAPETGSAPAGQADPLRTRFVIAAAAMVGLSFFLMELVWYRMMAPILGGSSYTFGLILAFALLGIGVGGLLYAREGPRSRATLSALALTCGLEAAFLVLPLALRDTVAIMAMMAQEVGKTGFPQLVAGWSVVTGSVVLPAAIVSGYQFPLLVGLMGQGRRNVGREVGQLYAWNTLGAITGSLLGGFVLLPMLSATGAWRLAAALLLATGLGAVAMHVREGGERVRLVLPLAAMVLGAMLTAAEGPTVMWRHGSIGTGQKIQMNGYNHYRDQINDLRRRIVWERDGVESSVAIMVGEAEAFVINGKVDGNARLDAPTQVMLGLIGAILHPGEPRTSLVVGLGTGSSSGWLARIPTMERVDTVELEPAVVEIARRCGPVNENALDNPKVHLIAGDAREVLTTTGTLYDVIASEPSNPYRAGIASLFTQDFYQAVADRLAPDGVFVQWVQAYHIDAQTIRTIYATLSSVFPEVETWETKLDGDAVLVASRRPFDHDIARLHERANAVPYRAALRQAWGVAGVDGLFSGFIGNADLARTIAAQERGLVCTDDNSIVEYGFARTVGRGVFRLAELRQASQRLGLARPSTRGGQLDWGRVEEAREARALMDLTQVARGGDTQSPRGMRSEARRAFKAGNLFAAGQIWSQQHQEARQPMDRLVAAGGMVEIGHEGAERALAALAVDQPLTAQMLRAHWHARRGELALAASQLTEAFTALRTNPWPQRDTVLRALRMAPQIAPMLDPVTGRALFDSLGEPFAVSYQQWPRLEARAALARALDFEGLCVVALHDYEPHVPWKRAPLEERVRCYEANAHPLLGRARADLAEFMDHTAPTLLPGAAP